MTARALSVLEAPLAPSAPRGTPIVSDSLGEFALDGQTLGSFHVWTLGCQMNRSDSEEMAGALLSAGLSDAPEMSDADVIVINTCAIREAAEQKVIGRMGVLARLKQANPALRVVLTGCSVRADNRAVLRRRYPAVDLFLRPDEEPELVDRLGLAAATSVGRLARAETLQRVGRSVAATADRLPASRAQAVAAGGVARGSAIQAWLPIIYGCDKTCTYCIVPFSRGPERSRPFDEVVEEARQLGAHGYREVTLLGQNVNSYGHDLPPEARFDAIASGRELGRRLDRTGRPDIAALLREIDGIRDAGGTPLIPRLRFVTSHPWDLTDRLIAAIAECPSVCEHLHLPVQAGDDAVLRRMGRQYSVASYLRLVERLRAAVPGISLTTDVIVGFCGETEEQFQRTLELLREVRYDQVFAAAFSPRPGTPAARLLDDVAPVEKKRRLGLLLDLQEEIGLGLNEAWVGRTTRVLVEEVARERSHTHDEAEPAAGGPSQAQAVPPLNPAPRVPLVGRNREHKLVHLRGGPDLVGREVTVQVERAGPYSLVGRIAA